jgi:FAD/FMN-containing dehydrogenase
VSRSATKKWASYGRAWKVAGDGVSDVFSPRNEAALVEFVGKNGSADASQQKLLHVLYDTEDPLSSGSLQQVDEPSGQGAWQFLDLSNLCAIGFDEESLFDDAFGSERKVRVVDVQAGVRVDSLCDVLEQHELCLQCTPEHVRMSVGSVVTGGWWHSARARAQVLSVRVLLLDGSEPATLHRDVRAASGESALDAVLGRLGTTGILLSCRLRLQPLQALRETNYLIDSNVPATLRSATWAQMEDRHLRSDPMEASCLRILPLSDQALLTCVAPADDVDARQLPEHPGGLPTLLSEQTAGVSSKSLDVMRKWTWVVSSRAASHHLKELLQWRVAHRPEVSTAFRRAQVESVIQDEGVHLSAVAQQCAWSVPWQHADEAVSLLCSLVRLACGGESDVADARITDAIHEYRTLLRVTPLEVACFDSADGSSRVARLRLCWRGREQEYGAFQDLMDVFFDVLRARLSAICLVETHLFGYVPLLRAPGPNPNPKRPQRHHSRFAWPWKHKAEASTTGLPSAELPSSPLDASRWREHLQAAGDATTRLLLTPIQKRFLKLE